MRIPKTAKVSRREDEETYSHQSAAFSRAMKRIEQAPAREVRAFAKFAIDVMWGLGEGTKAKSPRRLDFEKEWDCAGILSDFSTEIHARSFNPFLKK